MNYLLDTHTFLWFFEGNTNLSKKAKTIIENPKNINFVSIASIWEVAIKTKLGKIKLGISLEDLKTEILKNNIEILPLDFEHIIELSTLDDLHRDPFDRIIISQAISENCFLISKDSMIGNYKKVKLIW